MFLLLQNSPVFAFPIIFYAKDPDCFIMNAQKGMTHMQHTLYPAHEPYLSLFITLHGAARIFLCNKSSSDRPKAVARMTAASVYRCHYLRRLPWILSLPFLRFESKIAYSDFTVNATRTTESAKK